MKLLLFLFFFLSLPVPGLCQEQDVELDRPREDHLSKNLSVQNLENPQLNSIDLFDEKVVREIQKLLKENPLSRISASDMKNLILEKVSNRPSLQRYLRNSPRLLNCLVELIRDQRAMSDALSIFLNKSQLKLYGLIWLVLFLLQWMFKKIFFRSSWGLVKRFTLNLLVAVIFTATSLGVFYGLFRPELFRSIQIIAGHLQ